MSPVRLTLMDRVGALLVCPSCLGLRFGPGHLSKRLFGICGRPS